MCSSNGFRGKTRCSKKMLKDVPKERTHTSKPVGMCEDVKLLPACHVTKEKLPLHQCSNH